MASETMPLTDTVDRPVPVQRTASRRLVSLDMCRGLAVFGMMLVNLSDGMKEAGFPVYVTLLHQRWDGLHLADLVFPGFLTMIGISIPLALSGRERTGDAARHFWRGVRLFVLGFVLTNLSWLADSAHHSWRLFGVLQRLGMAYTACSLLFLFVGARARLAIMVALLVLYWPLALLPSLDTLPNDIWLRGHNFIGSFDRVWLGPGDHNYIAGPTGYDPEGLLGTLPAIAQCLLGVAVGDYLLRNRDATAFAKLAATGAVLAIVGVAWGQIFPIIKDIWSSPFVLVTSGLTIAVVAGLSLALDRGWANTWPLRILGAITLPLGINAIAAYVLHGLTGQMIAWDVFMKPARAVMPIIGAANAALIPPLLSIAFVWVCMDYLRRKNWIVRI